MNSVFSYTGELKKTSPSAGIDIEPWINNGKKLFNITINNCIMSNNKGPDLQIYILEDFNMLSTAFRSCYTTDGVSTEYYLPIKNLSNEEYENIKISYTSPSGAVFTWKIDYNHLSSGAVIVGNETYGMSIDRTLGRLAVLGDDGMPKALPASKGYRSEA